MLSERLSRESRGATEYVICVDWLGVKVGVCVQVRMGGNKRLSAQRRWSEGLVILSRGTGGGHGRREGESWVVVVVYEEGERGDLKMTALVSMRLETCHTHNTDSLSFRFLFLKRK